MAKRTDPAPQPWTQQQEQKARAGKVTDVVVVFTQDAVVVFTKEAVVVFPTGAVVVFTKEAVVLFSTDALPVVVSTTDAEVVLMYNRAFIIFKKKMQ